MWNDRTQIDILTNLKSVFRSLIVLPGPSVGLKKSRYIHIVIIIQVSFKKAKNCLPFTIVTKSGIA